MFWGSCGHAVETFVAVDDIYLSESPCPHQQTCNFNDGLCDLTNEENATRPWIVGYGRTYNSDIIQGVEEDHTDGKSMYAYIDLTTKMENSVDEKVKLILNTEDVQKDVQCLKFSYLHYGEDAIYFFAYLVSISNLNCYL